MNKTPSDCMSIYRRRDLSRNRDQGHRGSNEKVERETQLTVPRVVPMKHIGSQYNPRGTLRGKRKARHRESVFVHSDGEEKSSVLHTRWLNDDEFFSLHEETAVEGTTLRCFRRFSSSIHKKSPCPGEEGDQ